MKKPATAAGYETGLAREAKRMCLHIATILGDVMDDIIVVGGLAAFLDSLAVTLDDLTSTANAPGESSASAALPPSSS